MSGGGTTGARAYLAVALALALASCGEPPARVDASGADATESPGTGGSGTNGSGTGGSGTGGSGTGGSGAGELDPCPPPSSADRGLWVWTAAPATDVAEREALLAFAEAQGVRRVFLQVGTGPDTLADNLMQQAPAALASFLDDAATRCVAVELLAGEPEWTLAEHHAVPVALAEQLVAFTASLEGARPAGLHLDVEAHAVRGMTSGGTTWDWGTPAQQHDLVAQLLDLLASVRGSLIGSGLALSADVPFWFDDPEAAFNPLAHGGAHKLASEHVVDLVDRAVLMTYRDRAFGVGDGPSTSANGIFDLAASEVAYAGARDRAVVLGVETGGCATVDGVLTLDGTIDDELTFCDEGLAVMDAELARVAEAYGGAPGLAGFAVHHWGSVADPRLMAP